MRFASAERGRPRLTVIPANAGISQRESAFTALRRGDLNGRAATTQGRGARGEIGRMLGDRS
ncbi:protein of unknown function [Micropruina glycogenica]|uniref:Uncharacterized protein n=1 Tax=Micropruina glycogenica TaxID=75385 RepID=A0A2N9JHU8_9ACTN|nr:protein of unknown function [Micropruina glycogenica]